MGVAINDSCCDVVERAVGSPPIVIVSLMRLEGVTGVQAHMREFVSFLQTHGLSYEVATPFHALATPLMYLLVGLRRILEWISRPAAVWLYRSGHALSLWLRLRRLVARYPRCVMYAQCPVSAAVALRCAKSTDQQVAMVVHFSFSQADEWIVKGAIADNGPIATGIRRLEQRVLPRLHRIVYVSKFMQSELIQRIPGIEGVQSAVIPNFVKTCAGIVAFAECRGRDLVSIGSLEPRKNQQFLLHVLARAKSRGNVFSLTLVGDGPDHRMLEALAYQLGIIDQVYFAGATLDARKYIAGHRLYVHAASMDNLPVVLVEALSAGVPLLAAAVGGIAEVFDESVEGRFWPLDDVDAACKVLEQMLSDDENLAQMGRAASLRFQRVFEASVVGEHLYNYLQTDFRSPYAGTPS